ncbi:MAG: DUF2235 domain-containing protein [Acidobacteria bacterium]|nr:DUF2235 domain-containing protein [Acidobacteriota bacterium]
MKKLAVFFDGTWNRADQKTRDGIPCPTNILKLFELLCPSDARGNPQLANYIGGVGTRRGERLRGGILGYGLSENIKEGYRFLASNFQPGDEIFIFGFSRGAYSARSLSGMIRNLGVLRRDRIHMINEAYRRYKSRSAEWHPDSVQAVNFRKENSWSMPVNGEERTAEPGSRETLYINFLGVFDTVGALGAPFLTPLGWLLVKLSRCDFHDTQLSSIVQNACHALAIDEHRWPFRPTPLTPNINHIVGKNFDERWFAGAHANIGGGYAQTGLSDLTLDWMVDKASSCVNPSGCGLSFDWHGLNPTCRNLGVLEPPAKSQNFAYRLASILLVKLPGTFGLATKSTRTVLRCLQWSGDYHRPIHAPQKPKKGLGPNLDGSVIAKMNRSAGNYAPPNVP